MSLWWLEPGWTDAQCNNCGATIYPEGDPDWGLCWPCMQHSTTQAEEQAEYERQQQERYEQEMIEMERHFREHPHG